MNLVKSKILLDKINRLYTSMSLDEENVAPIEKDLMRDYIKQLYETFLDDNSISPAKEKTKRATKVSFTLPQAKPSPVPKPAPPPVTETSLPPRQVQPPPTPPPPPPPPVVEPVRTYTSKPVEEVKKQVHFVDPEHAELFNLNLETKELSEKLGQTRIPDLSKAMGVNERIFTINELFGADNSLYRAVIKELEKMQSFEEAKAYLSRNIAEKYNWTHKSKRNKAKNFIKLVRRRYL